VPGVSTRLADVWAASEAVPYPLRAFFYDEPALRAHPGAGQHVLYEAVRDAAPPHRAATGGEPALWRLDQVFYPAVPLPSGEMNRSVGHWNPPGQREVFEVQQGRVALLVRRRQPGSAVEMFDCAPGALVPIPPGSWHVTYVLQGPAVVANVYSAMVQPPPEPAREVRGKYFNSPPVRVGLRCASGAMLGAPVPSGGPDGVVLFGDPADTPRATVIRHRVGPAGQAGFALVAGLLGQAGSGEKLHRLARWCDEWAPDRAAADLLTVPPAGALPEPRWAYQLADGHGPRELRSPSRRGR
jgi:hypothetical protein